jgi:beta-phosphoglucomutase
MKREIRLIVSDFDGTLVDTRYANFLAYRDVLQAAGYGLTAAKYDDCFGLRFEEFMNRLGIVDPGAMKLIQSKKTETYPDYFSKIQINNRLASFIEGFRHDGGYTAIASTARRVNLLNVLEFVGLKEVFDLIISAEDISRPKPDPECYLKAMAHFHTQPHECLIFEDAAIGVQAAMACGANYIVVKEFNHGT